MSEIVTNKKAIVIVSFGTIHKETREKCIDNLEKIVKRTYPNYKVYTTFTSHIVLKRLRENNVFYMSTQECMEKLVKDNVKEVYILTTYCIAGLEFDKLFNIIKDFHNKFDKISLTKPLLSTSNDYLKVLNLAYQKSGKKENEILIFMGHGTPHFSNYIYPQLYNIAKKQNMKSVFIATIDGYQKLDDIISQIQAIKAKKILLMPLMFVAGKHAVIDMSGDNEDSWKSNLEKKGYSVRVNLKGLGEFKEIQNIFLEHLSEII